MNLVKRMFTSLAVLLIAASSASSASARLSNSCLFEPKPISSASPQPSGPTVVLALHGFGLNKQSYSDLGSRLQERGLVFESVDVLGFGEKASSRLDFRRAVADVTAEVNALKRRYPRSRMILLGESMGGALAITVASTHPGLIDGVVASEPAYKVTVNPLVYPAVFFSLLIRPDSENRVPLRFARRVTRDQAFLSHIEEQLKGQRGYTARELWRFRSLMKGVPASVAHLCHTPVLFLQGDSDRLVRPSGTVYLSQISSLAEHKLVTVPMRGHLLLEENQANAEILDELGRWLLSFTDNHSMIAQISSSDARPLHSSTEEK